MKRWLMMVVLLAVAMPSLLAEKESFKKKRTPSLRTLSEQYGQELTEIMKAMPKLQRQLAKQQKELARLEQETITALTSLLDNEEKLTKDSVQKLLDEATKTNKVLQQQIHANEERIEQLKTLGKKQPIPAP